MSERTSVAPVVVVALATAAGYGLLELAFFATRNHLLPWRGEHGSLFLTFFALHGVVALLVALATLAAARFFAPSLAGTLPLFAPLGALVAIDVITNFRERIYSLPRDVTGTLVTLALLAAFALVIWGLTFACRRSARLAWRVASAGAAVLVGVGVFQVVTARPTFEREVAAPRSSEDTLVATTTDQRVLILGIDGLAWEILDPLIASGRAPNFASLASAGSTFRLKTIRPTFSPVIWTSVSTGKDRFQHRIHDVVQTILPGGTRLHRSILRTAFYTKTTGVFFRALDTRRMLRLAPYRSSQVEATSVFEAASEAGLSATQIEWYVSWPARPLSGVSISDRFHLQPLADPMPGAVAPKELGAPLLEHVVRHDDVTLERVLEFVDTEGLDAAGAERWAHEHQEFVEEMRLNLARDLSTRNVAVDLLERDRAWRLFGVYFRAVDLTHHLTWPLRNAEGDVRQDPDLRLRTAIRRYYEFIDGVLGEIVVRVPDDVTIVLLSDHGYEDRFAHARAPDGCAILSGGVAKPAPDRGEIGIYDVAPTVAAVLGLPVAGDQVAGPRLDLLAPDFVAAHPVRSVPTWDREGETGSVDLESGGDIEAAEIDRLRALGYIQ